MEQAKQQKSSKKSADAAPAKQAKVEVVKVEKKVKPPRVKHHARGSARAARRVGLKKGWKNIANAQKMAPPAGAALAPAEELKLAA
jgi:hypothetical protein